MTYWIDEDRGQSWFPREEVKRIARQWFLWGFGIGGGIPMIVWAAGKVWGAW